MFYDITTIMDSLTLWPFTAVE